MLVACALPLHAQINPEWTTAQKPFHIAGNLYYVGSRDLAAYLVTTSKGNILINANLATSPPHIKAAVEELGFKWADTRIRSTARRTPTTWPAARRWFARLTPN